MKTLVNLRVFLARRKMAYFCKMRLFMLMLLVFHGIAVSPCAALQRSGLNLALIKAVRQNDSLTVKRLLGQGADPNSILHLHRNPTILARTTVLHLASVERENPEIVRLLLSYGAKIDMPDSNGSTALIGAAYAGYFSTVKLLTSKRANINAVDREGRTSLLMAVMICHIDIVQFLISQGAQVRIHDKSGMTPLMWAVYCPKGRPMVKMLLEHGADISAKAKDGNTAQLIATVNHRKDILALLAQYKSGSKRR